MITIVFTGGGTGGHIYPGLAVIDELKKKEDVDVCWIGNSKGMDRNIVTEYGVAFYGIPSGKLRRYFSLQNLRDVFLIIAGFFSSIRILRRVKPALVFSKGGFVSVPPCRAAKFLHIPVITHECDFSPGLATRINARSASAIFVSYEATREAFPERMRSKVTVTGNPVRFAFYTASAVRGREFLQCTKIDKPILLILGASLGARQINDLIATCIDELCKRFIVVHQTGIQNADQIVFQENPVVKAYYRPYAFIRMEMPDVLAASSLVIGRSGANTVWECASAGKPMILIPLEKGSSRGDQVENARYFVAAGAAMMLTGTDVSKETLLDRIAEIYSDSGIYDAMAQKAAALGNVRPAPYIADLLVHFSTEKNGVGR